MGSNFSLIVVRIINKSKRSKRSKEKMECKDVEKYKVMENSEEIISCRSRRSTVDSAISSEDESAECKNVSYGTSNHNFYKFRNQKKVITLFNRTKISATFNANICRFA